MEVLCQQSTFVKAAELINYLLSFNKCLSTCVCIFDFLIFKFNIYNLKSRLKENAKSRTKTNLTLKTKPSSKQPKISFTKPKIPLSIQIDSLESIEDTQKNFKHPIKLFIINRRHLEKLLNIQLDSLEPIEDTQRTCLFTRFQVTPLTID